MIKKILLAILLLPTLLYAQINTERVMTIARNALYFEDYVLSIQYFNQVINAKPYLYEPYFFRALAKINLDDFQGAEMDCDLAIQRNPFVVGAYQIRGLARIRQDKFDGAIEDYKTALKYDPENVVLWHNLSLCHMQKEDFSSAKEDLGKLLAIAPRYTRAYLMRGEVNLKQNDTIQALKDFDTAIDMDRFHQNNLRGAMSDYDLALDIDPNNFLGHYNRGLLRAQVGDDNRAIEDFDFVLKIEPDNMMATFNRGLLRAQTGDYRGAISDYSRVIDEYPNFMAGYYHRAEARKKIGDRKGAEQDEFKVMKMQLDKRNGVTSGGNGKDVADNNNGDSGQDSSKTRKKSDKNMENYRKIVIADDSEADQRYKSDYRGRVQDRNVTIKLEPMYALTYYEKLSDVKRIVHYHKYIDELNHSKLLPKPLRITNMESPLTEEQVRFHFALIDAHTSEIVADEKNAKKRFMRGLDFYLVQDFASSIDDFTQSILLDDTFFPAYFMRALVRYKQLEYKKAEAGMSEGAVSGASEVKKAEVTAMDYDIVKNDLDHVIRLAPDFVYGYYNRGNILSMLKDYRAALVDYDKAIELNPDFAEAYFNRGLTHIFLGNNRQGISDLSKAGELGIVSAYNIIKRFTNTQQ